MEARRRVAETVRAEGATSGTEGGESSDGGPVEQKPVTSPLVKEGLRLYAEAEKSGFRDEAALTRSLKHFLRAADKGVDDATEWIASFLDSMSALPSSVVLPPSLLNLLQWVKQASTEEKEVYLVAEEMYRTMARGRTAIPEAEIDDAIQNLLTSRFEHSPEMTKSAKHLKMSVKKLLCSALEKSKSNEVTAEAFCEAAVTYARGEVPHEGGELTPEQLQDFSRANILKKTINYPVQTVHYVKRSILKMIERRGVKWIWASFPTKQFYLLLLAYFLPMISMHFILSSIATAVFVTAFITMVIGTLQIILNAEKIFSFMEYSSIFQYFSKQDRKIDTKKPEALLIKRSALPYLTFALSLCIALVMLNLSYQQLVFNEVICILSALFTAIIFFQFQCYKSTIFIVSASSRLLSWLYVFLVLFHGVIPIPEFLFYMGTTIFSIPIFPGVALKLNLVTAIQFPLQFALIAYFLYSNKWHNFYSGLGPYLLFVSWWVLCRHFFARSSPFILLVATFGIMLFLVLAPFLPILFLGSPLFFLMYYGLSRQFFISLCLVVIFALVLLFVGKYFGQLMETKWLNIPVDYLVLLQILISIPAILLGARWFATLYSPVNLPPVTLTQYSEYCGPQNWAGNNMVQTQLDCLHLQNRVLTASGTVGAVRIEQITNSKEASLSSLPASVGTVLTCLFGQSTPMCGHRSDMETCKQEYSGCHFHHSNMYTFAITMIVQLPPRNGQDSTNLSVALLASNTFAKIATNLTAGKRLNFNATFVSGMGSDKLTLQLVALNGTEEEEEETSDIVHVLVDQLISSVTNMFAIVFDVLLGYTTV